ncbi:alpha/beta hydrolase [Psychrobacillus sp. FSL K6-2684]|uniref:alpha/beta fold hydrolase n=1 Tax=unclassified Psychrobacillus TaxID=2636677 RepID=UPI001CD9A8AB|nr:alpha/beta hydrolase [Psychrobacillus sp. AK 1817]
MTTYQLCQKINVNEVEFYCESIKGSNDNLTVVFESGYGWDSNNWLPIKHKVSKFANVFIYDRDGIYKSEKSNKPKHSFQMIENLRCLLRKLDIKPPYIMVGHSFGGINVRLYASKYPQEVVGIILLDSVHEDQNKRMVPLFTKEVQEEYLGQFVVEASLDEFEESLEQVRGTNLNNIPLIVMTGSNQPQHT